MNAPATGANDSAPTPLVRIEAVEKRFGKVEALRGIDLAVSRGEVVCIIGPSGCGKSSLLRCVNGLHLPDSGRCRVDGQDIADFGRGGWRSRWRDARALDALRARVGMVFQQFNVWPHLTALENVTKAPVVVKGEAPEEARGKATKLLSRVGLEDRLGAYPEELSGGQQQRVAIARALAMEPILMLFDEPTSSLDPELVGIARALAMEPILMLFDEPTSSLDPELVGEVLAVMQELARDGMTMIVVTHELGFASRVADRIEFMEDGRIVEADPPRQILRDPHTDRLKQFLSRLVHVNAPSSQPIVNQGQQP